MRSWPTWGCPASKFDWYYDQTETCYVLEGRVIVTPTGEAGAPAGCRAHRPNHWLAAAAAQPA